MDDQRVDALLIIGIGAGAANARYLTGLPSRPGAPLWTLFPLHGGPTVIGSRSAARAQSADWVADVVPAAASYRYATIPLLQGLPLRQRRLGIVGLEPGETPAEIGAPAALVQDMLEATPGLELVDLSAPLRALRSRKSQEELALLRHSAWMLDTAFNHMDQVAAPAMSALELWAAGVSELCRLGSEMPPATRWAAAARPRALARPAHAWLAPGFVVTAELMGSSQGYAAQAVHTSAIAAPGRMVSVIYQEVGALWERALAAIEPGVPVSTVQGLVRTGAARLVKPRGGYRGATAWLSLHGAGLGGDTPRLDGRSLGSAVGAVPLEAEWAFSLGVWLRADVDGRQYLAGWEDPIFVSPHGGMRLGSRPPARLSDGTSSD
jgi:Xaa-Pro aminopeptidase